MSADEVPEPGIKSNEVPKSSTDESSGLKARQGSDVPFDFECFVDEHYETAYRFVLGMSGDDQKACKITQQAFYLAHTRSHQLGDPAKSKQWFLVILYGEFLRIHRGKSALPKVNLELSNYVQSSLKNDPSTGFGIDAVVKILQTLDEKIRVTVVLFYLTQLSYSQIADILRLPAGRVISNLSLGKQLLLQRLEYGIAYRPSEGPLCR